MYQIGDQVVYGIHGVCCILELEERNVERKKIRYFVLEPVDQPGTRYYVPAENPAALGKLRRLMSRAELEEIIACAKVRESCWIADENKRKQCYRELICGGDCVALLRMINTLHIHKKNRSRQGENFIYAMKTFCGMRKN